MRQIYACGANHFDQQNVGKADGQSQQTIIRFRRAFQDLKPESPGNAGPQSILWAGISQTCVHLGGNSVAITGHAARTLTVELPDDAAALPQQRAIDASSPFTSALGDHAGLKLLLHSSGYLYTVSDSHPGPHETLTAHNPAGPLLARIASTAAGYTAAIPLQAPAAQNLFVLTWPSLPSFLAWHASPSSPEHAPSSQTLLPGAPAALAASSTTIILRTRDGAVYTSGDARHAAALGRTPTPAEPAATPAPVPELAGLPASGVAGARGGWAGAAVSGAGDAWVWGMHAPGEDGGDAWLGSLGEEVAPAFWQVRVPGDEGAEARAVALGAAHALIVTGDGRLWSAGRDSHGQLGLGFGAGAGYVRGEVVERLGGVAAAEARREFVREELAGVMGRGEVVRGWREVVVEGAEGRAVDVVAGEWGSFVVFETEEE